MSDLPVALVTGARKGLGQHISRSLVTAGYEVVGCSRGAAESSDHYTHLEADVGDEIQVKMLLENIRRRFGRLDAVINNAGISSMNHSLLMPAETVKRIFDTNFMGTFLVSREAGKIMSRRKAGRIVNLTTIAVPMEVEGEAIYAASKSAVESLTRIMSRELGSVGITVNAVGPSPVDTDLIRGVPQEKMAALINRLAIKRVGTPDDVWNVVRFFLAPESNYITGQIVYLGGA